VPALYFHIQVTKLEHYYQQKVMLLSLIIANIYMAHPQITRKVVGNTKCTTRLHFIVEY